MALHDFAGNRLKETDLFRAALIAPLDPGDLILAQRSGALDPEAFGKFPGKVAFVPPGDQRDGGHCDQRAERSQRHVFLRIPNVSLGAEKVIAGRAADNRGCGPFQDFVERRCTHGEVEWEEITPETTDSYKA